MSPIILAGAGVLLLVLGLGLGYLFARTQTTRAATRANDVQKELDDYRRHVTEHFGQTAQHFQTLGQQYQSLYQHMAQGADALCDPAQSESLLGFAAGNAAAILSSDDQPEIVPDVIRDYAVSEEVEPPQEEPVVEAAAPAEPVDESSAADAPAAEQPVEETIADPVAAPTPAEKEPTMH